MPVNICHYSTSAANSKPSEENSADSLMNKYYSDQQIEHEFNHESEQSLFSSLQTTRFDIYRIKQSPVDRSNGDSKKDIYSHSTDSNSYYTSPLISETSAVRSDTPAISVDQSESTPTSARELHEVNNTSLLNSIKSACNDLNNDACPLIRSDRIELSKICDVLNSTDEPLFNDWDKTKLEAVCLAYGLQPDASCSFGLAPS